jgi:hypothetical protein
MQGLTEEKSKEEKRKFPVTRSFFILVSLVPLSGILFIVVSYLLTNVPVLQDVLRAVGETLISAAVVGVFVEIYLYDSGIKDYSVQGFSEEIRTNLGQHSNLLAREMTQEFTKTAESYSKQISQVSEKVESNLRAISALTALRAQPIASRTRMYEEGTAIVNDAKESLIIFQRTPSLLLGPKPYGKEPEDNAEPQFIKSLNEKINSITRKGKMKCIYLFSAIDTANDIDGFDETMKKEVRKRVDYFKKKEDETDYNFVLHAIENQISGPLAVSERTYMVWLGSDHHDRTLVLVANATIEAVEEQLNRIIGYKYQDCEELKKLLHLS